MLTARSLACGGPGGPGGPGRKSELWRRYRKAKGNLNQTLHGMAWRRGGIKATSSVSLSLLSLCWLRLREGRGKEGKSRTGKSREGRNVGADGEGAAVGPRLDSTRGLDGDGRISVRERRLRMNDELIGIGIGIGIGRNLSK